MTDPMPTFGDTIAAQSYLVNQEIESLTLPHASHGDEPLTYALPPELTFCFLSMASRAGCSGGVARGDLSPGPFPTRKGE